ncbi:MAG: DUF2510 domain-containing protein [Coriobacteriia bacterium]|nr:DUF2510 domain-containing protein [Coriobacteriia bacterium]
MSNPVPGWYGDPTGSIKLRFWDGDQWTDQFMDAPSSASSAHPHSDHDCDTHAADGMPATGQPNGQFSGIPASGQPNHAQVDYNQAAYVQTAAEPRSNPKAITALIFGIIGLATSELVVPGMIFSIIAMSHGKQGLQIPFMRSMANVGRILGIVGLIVSIASIVFWFIYVLFMVFVITASSGYVSFY